MQADHAIRPGTAQVPTTLKTQRSDVIAKEGSNGTEEPPLFMARPIRRNGG